MNNEHAQKMKDPRIVYGATCVWWDGIEKIGVIEQGGHRLPCCPHCKGVLFEMHIDDWWAGVERVKEKDPGYRDFIEWLKGKHFPSFEDAKKAYEVRSGRKVDL